MDGANAMSYNAYEIIFQKKHNKSLNKDQIQWFVEKYLEGHIPDYQMSAWLMAWAINGATPEESYALTDVILKSGEMIVFPGTPFIDKHSTGGIGDKTSFILAPIAAACGVHVPMVAGRGLGHTGGTVDKVEAIENFKTNLSLKEFKADVEQYGLALIAQTPEIAPADGKIYALRDVTATIDSIPLITASIMSKKLAEGAQGIVMDIKWGSAAFMRSVEQAEQLAHSLQNVAKLYKRKFSALISDMNQPLGEAIGHSNELIECFEVLKGRGPKDVADLSIELAAHMIYHGFDHLSLDQAREKALKSIQDGSALNQFAKLIERQGGNPEVVENYNLLPMAKEKTIIQSPIDGYLNIENCDQFGHSLIELGGGRKQKSDQIDFAVGIDFYGIHAQEITQGTPLLSITHHAEQKETVEKIKKNLFENVLKIQKDKPQTHPLIEKVIGDLE